MITRPHLAACLAGFLRLGWGYLPSIPVIPLCGQSDRQIDDGPRSTPQRPLVCIDDDGGSCPEADLRDHPCDRRGGSDGHVVSPIASRRPDKNSSRCCGFRYGSGRFTITSGMIARSRAIIPRASSNNPIWA